MKTLLIIIVICIGIYGTWEYFKTSRLIKIGTNLAEQAEPFSRVTDESNLNIVVIGDSTAVGTGASNPNNSIAGLIGDHYPSANIRNLGVNGRKTHEIISDLMDLDSQQSIDLLLIQIGGNDIVRYTNLKDLEQSISEVLTIATQKSSNVVLMTSGNVGTSKLLPIISRPVYRLRTLRVRSIFMKAASEKNVEYVDLYRKPSNDPYAKNPDKYYADDFFHPSSEGYSDWFSVLKHALPNLSNQK